MSVNNPTPRTLAYESTTEGSDDILPIFHMELITAL